VISTIISGRLLWKKRARNEAGADDDPAQYWALAPHCPSRRPFVANPCTINI